MKLGVILRIDIGEDKSIENVNKVAGEIYQVMLKENPELKGIRWNIDLNDNKFALGMFLSFTTSVFVKQVMADNFPDYKVYYSQYIKESGELELYNKLINKSSSSPSVALGQTEMPF